MRFRRPRPRIERVGPGRFALDIPREERELIRRLLPDLRALVEGRDPVTRRLFPTAYPDDPAKEREYRDLMDADLVAGRLAAIEVVDRTLGDRTIGTAELERWMEAVNSLRLVLGTRLDVSEKLPELDPAAPDAPAYAVYDYLGWMLEQAVAAMSAEMAAAPPAGSPPA